MKNIIFILLFFVSSQLFARQTVVYFGNGIMTKYDDAKKATQMLDRKLKAYLSPSLYNQIYDVVNHYNSTHLAGVHDLVESAYQKLSLANLLDKITTTAHSVDLGLQVNAYENTVLNNKDIILVAHSQGNLFAIEAYNQLTDEEKQHFYAISVASPAHRYIIDDKPIKNPFISWDTDVVAHLGLYGSVLTPCPVRKVSWTDAHPAVNAPKPNAKYTFKKQIGSLLHHKWRAEEKFGPLQWSIDVHSFSFYMGESLHDIFDDTEFHDPFTGNVLKTDVAKKFILEHIKSQLELNAQAGGDNGTDPGSGDTNTTNPDNGGDSGSGTELPSYKDLCPDINYPQNLSNVIVDQINNLIKTSLKDPDICEKIKDIIETAGSIPGL